MGKMRVIKKLVVSVGEYQKDGQTKKEWRNVGVMMQDEDDPDNYTLKFDMPLPMKTNDKGYAECWVKAFDLRDNNQQQSTPPPSSEPSPPPPSSQTIGDGSTASSHVDDPIDDIPFSPCL